MAPMPANGRAALHTERLHVVGNRERRITKTYARLLIAKITLAQCVPIFEPGALPFDGTAS